MSTKEYNDVWHDSNVIPNDCSELVVIAACSKERYDLYIGYSRLKTAEQQWYFTSDDGDIFDYSDILKWAYCKDLVYYLIYSDNNTPDSCKNTEKPFY